MLELSADKAKGEIAERRLGIPIRGIEIPEDIREIETKIAKQHIGDPGDEWRWMVTAQADILDPVIVNEQHTGQMFLYDYKVTSVWSVLNGEKPEWERQVNINAAIHRHNRERVDQAAIVAIMRDWQVRKARHEKEYPPEAVKVIGIPLWTQDETVEYMRRRVKLHQKAILDYIRSGFNPNVLPMCSDEERWYRGATFAVKFMSESGKLNKNAKRKFDSKTDALQFMSDNPTLPPKGKKWAPVEERPGENIRCLDYCDVWFKCPFGRKLREDAKAAESLVNEKSDESED